MRLKLPNETIILDPTLSSEAKLIVIEKLLTKKIEFLGETITLDRYFNLTWDTNSTRVCLDIIGYYLTREYKQRDKEVLSRKSFKQMTRGNKYNTPYSSLSNKDKLKVGILDYEDYENKQNQHINI